ncbi:hypothetical protein [Kitasatospora sp. NPDC001683]
MHGVLDVDVDAEPAAVDLTGTQLDQFPDARGRADSSRIRFAAIRCSKDLAHDGAGEGVQAGFHRVLLGTLSTAALWDRAAGPPVTGTPV